jgi:hypothetical protein
MGQSWPPPEQLRIRTMKPATDENRSDAGWEEKSRIESALNTGSNARVVHTP